MATKSNIANVYRFSMKFLKEKPKSFAPYIGLEDNFQIAVSEFLNLKGLFWLHPANERKTKLFELKSGKKISLEGLLLKRKGVKPGASDNIILEPRKGFHGFVIELKVGKNQPTDHQLAFLEAARIRGYKTLITWSLDEFIWEVENYLS